MADSVEPLLLNLNESANVHNVVTNVCPELKKGIVVCIAFVSDRVYESIRDVDH